MTTPIPTEDYLMHFKYLKKIKDGAKTRYFYTQQEIQAYYDQAKNKVTNSDAYKQANSVVNKANATYKQTKRQYNIGTTKYDNQFKEINEKYGGAYNVQTGKREKAHGTKYGRVKAGLSQVAKSRATRKKFAEAKVSNTSKNGRKYVSNRVDAYNASQKRKQKKAEENHKQGRIDNPMRTVRYDAVKKSQQRKTNESIRQTQKEVAAKRMAADKERAETRKSISQQQRVNAGKRISADQQRERAANYKSEAQKRQNFGEKVNQGINIRKNQNATAEKRRNADANRSNRSNAVRSINRSNAERNIRKGVNTVKKSVGVTSTNYGNNTAVTPGGTNSVYNAYKKANNAGISYKRHRRAKNARNTLRYYQTAGGR